MNKEKRKIAIISHSLAGGGAERFSGLLSGMLYRLGHEIHNITITENVDYSFEGKLYNLGEIVKHKNFLFKKLSKSLLLYKYLKSNEIDTIIDNRSRNNFFREVMFKFIFGIREVYYVVHNFNLEIYFPKSIFLGRWLYKNANQLICVSNAIEQKVRAVYNLTNCTTVYNPVQNISISEIESDVAGKTYILYFGRLENRSKNLLLLLAAYQASKIYEKGIQLVFMGEGLDRNILENKIKDYNLEAYVRIIPYQKNPFAIVQKSKFTVLSSDFEGFPMSIIESLALGVPVVSVDCNSGPREIIQNEYNGLLVENHNVAVLANALARLAADEKLHQNCKNNAKKSVEHLSLENIAKQWKALLTEK